MSDAHHRPKQPDLVRQQLLRVAAQLSLTGGFGGISLAAVAQAAGVSKGGLLHHFPNRLALLDGLFDDLTDKFDRAISADMRNDPVPQGRFTRAYLTAVFAMDPAGETGDDATAWRALTIAMLAEPHLRTRWRRWVSERAEDFVGTDSSSACLLARMTADGLWLADLIESHDIDPQARRAMFARLKALTLE